MNERPTTVEELSAMIRGGEAIRLRGGGTKLGAADDSPALDLTALSGIVDYAPAECVLTAQGGTPIRVIASELGKQGQYLPFDPPFMEEGATIGGTVAAGLSGPRRYRYGGVRDFVIGVRIVDGEGRVIRSGGKVVKNAAGFLLHHGMVGSCGRFGAITEVTVKVFPSPESRRTLTVDAGSVDEAFRLAQGVEQSRRDCEAIDFDERGVLTLTIAGRAEAIDARLERLARSVPGGTDLTDWGRTSPPGTDLADRGRTSPLGTDLALVKVAGLMRHWRELQPYVRTARFMCAGAVAWLETAEVSSLSQALHGAGLNGQIIRGRGAGARIGRVAANEFEERVRRVLDPHHRFHAASHPPR